MNNPYVVVQANTIYKLEIEVRRLINLGYSVSGSISVTHVSNGNILYIQPMIKID